MKKKINKRKFLRRLIVVVLLLGIGGFYVANRKLKNYGYSGVFDLISTYRSNTTLASNVNPKVIQLNLSKSDFDFIKNRRKIALDRGLQINDGDNYVNCSVVCDGDSTIGKMRLKGHMTDHLEGDKWSFRVKTEQDVLGMYRFSLQHPGTRNYIYEWVYHQLLKNEDVIYLKYDFVNVKLNDKDLGIYALEEHFGQHVLKRNNRPKGAIIRWSPNLYWEGRIDEFQQMYLNQEYADYSSSFAEPYDKGVITKDKELLENYQIAAFNLEQFRRGVLKTSEVFDVEKMARFHAIIDLVGGHHSLDWSDVKFYYNSETKKVEPVGYESFSIRKTDQIAGQQVRDDYSELQLNFHKQLFADPVFYAVYILNLERIADEAYLKNFIDKIQPEFDEKLGIIAKEWPYRKFNFEGYFENIRLIKNNLDLPKPFHAFSQSNNKDSIVLSLAPVSDFPIEIIGLKKKNKINYLKPSMFLLAKSRHTVIKYFDMTFYGDYKKAKNLILLAKIPGSKTIFEVEVANYPAYKFKNEKINNANKPTLKIDTTIMVVNGSKIYLKNKKSVLTQKTIIPKDYELILKPGQKLMISDSLIVYGKLSSHGFTDLEVNIQTKKKGIIQMFGILQATNTQFTGQKLIQSNHAQIDFYNCQFYDVLDCFIEDYQSTININTCQSGNVNVLFKLNETDSNFKNCDFNNGHQIVNSNGAVTNFVNCRISEYSNFSALNYSAQCYTWDTSISNADTVIKLTNSSTFNSYGGRFINFDVGFLVHKNENKLNGKSEYTLYKTETAQFLALEKNI